MGEYQGWKEYSMLVSIGIVFNGQVTALDCKSSLNTNCRIGLAVRGFESLPTHTMQSSPNGMASPFQGEIMRV